MFSTDSYKDVSELGRVTDVKRCKLSEKNEINLCVAGLKGVLAIDESGKVKSKHTFNNISPLGSFLNTNIILSRDMEIVGYARRANGPQDYNQLLDRDGGIILDMEDYSIFAGCGVTSEEKIICIEGLKSSVKLINASSGDSNEYPLNGYIQDAELALDDSNSVYGAFILDQKSIVHEMSLSGEYKQLIDLSEYGYKSEFDVNECKGIVDSNCLLIYSNDRYLLLNPISGNRISSFAAPYLNGFFFALVSSPTSNRKIIMIMGNLLKQGNNIAGLDSIEQHFFAFDLCGNRLHHQVFRSRWGKKGILLEGADEGDKNLRILIPSGGSVQRITVMEKKM